MQIHKIKRNTENKTKKRVGRGGVSGKTSGRGTKGQSSRAGNKKRPQLRDIIRKIPRRRGRGKNLNTPLTFPYVVVSLSQIETAFSKGEVVNPKSLYEKKLVKKEGGKFPAVKILANGTLTKSVSFENCKVSTGAKEAIEKAGGKIV